MKKIMYYPDGSYEIVREGCAYDLTRLEGPLTPENTFEEKDDE